jgi:ubiquinone/menaquinone biosynthesis C-methylase UbiE
MEDDEHAASYMVMYGEGPGCDTRKTISQFINPGETVLDVGCGPAWNADHFIEFGPMIAAYKGTDYSPRFVRVANERIKEKYDTFFHGATLIELGDCRDIKEKDNSWDVVILQDILEHTNGYEKTTEEALRVAKKRVIVTFWHMDHKVTTHINDDRDKGEEGYGAWYNQDEWEEYIDSLPYMWTMIESKPTDNRQHLFYVIDKEE